MKKAALLIGILFILTLQVRAASSQIQMAPQDSTVTFVFSQRLSVGESFSIPLGDIDGDEDLDAVVINYNELSRVWTNDGNGVYSAAQQLGYMSGHGGELGDLDGDGDLDLFLVHNLDSDRVYLNDGNGVFTTTYQILGNADDYGVYVDLGDIDRDDDLDALVQNYLHRNRVWFNNGEGIFGDPGPFFGNSTQKVILGDLDGDDDLDAVTTHVVSGTIAWMNDGTGNFPWAGVFCGGVEALSAYLGDVDFDEDLDLFIGNGVYYGGHGFAELYLNESVTGFGDGVVPLPSPRFSLDQNFPNPFNPVTRIRYELPESMRITLKIYDVRGRVVKTLAQGKQSGGTKAVVWDGTDNRGRPVGSGVYIYRIESMGVRTGGTPADKRDMRRMSRKMTLTR